jgi:hypothetical protein
VASGLASARRRECDHDHVNETASASAIETVSETAIVRKIVRRSVRRSVIASGRRFCLWLG